jgi:benzoyl-CoA reductase/2-hydroxyglutaryl-CoA dehydratase subunit BcrC/BadD/HgdB
MSIREIALQNPAFSELYYAYRNREAEADRWRAGGGKVLGKLGFDVPDELAIAAGFLPVQVYAEPEKPLAQADKYLEYAFDPMVRCQFEKLVDGTYKEQLDALAISNSTDVIIRIFLYLREIQRSEPEMPLPPLTFMDWLFTRNRMHQERDELIVRLFMEQLEEWSGKKLTDEAIREAASICNEDRAALREMACLRHGEEVRITGSEALVIIGSAYFMERSRHAKLVKEVVQAAQEWPVLEGPRVFVTGSAQENTALYEKLENAGAVIVGEDHDWGDRFYERDFSMEYPVVRAAVDRYMLREFSSKKAFVSQRVEALDRSASETGADAVLFYTNIYDDSGSWDYPSQRKSLESRGIATLHMAKMAYPVEKNEDLDERLAAFVRELKEGK